MMEINSLDPIELQKIIRTLVETIDRLTKQNKQCDCVKDYYSYTPYTPKATPDWTRPSTSNPYAATFPPYRISSGESVPSIQGAVSWNDAGDVS